MTRDIKAYTSLYLKHTIDMDEIKALFTYVIDKKSMMEHAVT